MKAVLIDYVCSFHKEEHLQFNKQLVSILPDKLKLTWLGDHEYGNSLFRNSEHVKLHTIPFSKKFTPTEAIRRYLFIIRFFINSKDWDTVIFLSFDNSIFPLFIIFSAFFIRKKRVIAMIHNNLESLDKSWLKRTMFRASQFCIKTKYIVLTQGMKLITDKLLNTESVLLHHPAFDYGIFAKQNDKSFLVIGRQAVHFCQGGYLDSFILACKSPPHIKNSTIKLTIAGPCTQGAKETGEIDIQILPEFISRSDYETIFKATTFVIFPDSDETKFRASGTLMDSLSTHCVFIAPKVGHFLEFEGCGILYNRGDFKTAISKALELTMPDIEAFRKNIRKKITDLKMKNASTVMGLRLI
jgi:hypothetical protein